MKTFSVPLGLRNGYHSLDQVEYIMDVILTTHKVNHIEIVEKYLIYTKYVKSHINQPQKFYY
jgi:hypothetical protein